MEIGEREGHGEKKKVQFFLVLMDREAREAVTMTSMTSSDEVVARPSLGKP